MREAREGEEALRKLRHFKLQDAQCFSEEDRIAIVSLIAKWWGEDEALTASNDAGIQRFEQYVYVGRERQRICLSTSDLHSHRSPAPNDATFNHCP